MTKLQNFSTAKKPSTSRPNEKPDKQLSRVKQRAKVKARILKEKEHLKIRTNLLGLIIIEKQGLIRRREEVWYLCDTKVMVKRSVKGSSVVKM